MSIPGGVVADLIVVKAGFILPGLKAFFDGPPACGNVDELLQGLLVYPSNRSSTRGRWDRRCFSSRGCIDGLVCLCCWEFGSLTSRRGVDPLFPRQRLFVAIASRARRQPFRLCCCYQG